MKAFFTIHIHRDSTGPWADYEIEAENGDSYAFMSVPINLRYPKETEEGFAVKELAKKLEKLLRD